MKAQNKISGRLKKAAKYAERAGLGTYIDSQIEKAFASGAQWMIEKATAWLAKQGSKANDGVVMICVEDFVKAMEE